MDHGQHGQHGPWIMVNIGSGNGFMEKLRNRVNLSSLDLDVDDYVAIWKSLLYRATFSVTPIPSQVGN